MRALAFLTLILATTAASPVARADDAKTALARATQQRAAAILTTEIADAAGSHAPGSKDGDLVAVAHGLDALLPDTAQDLGLTVDVASWVGERKSERELLASAKTRRRIVVAPTIRAVGSEIEIRISVAEPDARSLRVRTEKAAREDVNIRAIVMLRDLAADLGVAAAHVESAGPQGPVTPGVITAPARSAGRAILVANATVFGGLVGFSIQKSSGSDDPRLLYPLLAVGAGAGLGGSIIVAEEWDVGVGDAWFLSAGTWWPSIAGHLIYEGRFGPSSDTPSFQGDRFAFGLVGGTTGITLATLGLSLHGMGEGGALLAHSGGGLGLVFGGLTELMARGDIHRTPFAGMGYGAGLGWLAAAAIATQVDVAPSRVLFVDLGAFLGGLGGAALASPFVFGEQTQIKQRAFVGITAGSALFGSGVALYMTRDAKKAQSSVHWLPNGAPDIGVIGESAIGSRSAPVLGVGWHGTIQ